MFTAMRYFILCSLLLAPALAQSRPPCRATFSVVRKDEAGDFLVGFRQETRDWFQKKMAKKYPDVCYSDEPTEIVLFFSARPDVFHGVRTVEQTNQSPSSGTVTDSNTGQQVGTYEGTVQTTTTSQIPYEVEYNHLHLTIEMKLPSGVWKPLESFDGKTLHPTFYGVCTRNCHPNHSMIEEAIKYLHNMK